MAFAIGEIIYTVFNIQVFTEDELSEQQESILNAIRLGATASSWWDIHYFDPLHNAEYPNILMTVLDSAYNLIAYTRVAEGVHFNNCTYAFVSYMLSFDSSLDEFRFGDFFDGVAF